MIDSKFKIHLAWLLLCVGLFLNLWGIARHDMGGFQLICWVPVILAESTVIGFRFISPLFLMPLAVFNVYVLPWLALPLNYDQKTMDAVLLAFHMLLLGGIVSLFSTIFTFSYLNEQGKMVSLGEESLSGAKGAIVKLTMLFPGSIILIFITQPGLLSEVRGVSQYNVTLLGMLLSYLALFLPPLSIIAAWYLARRRNHIGKIPSLMENKTIYFALLSPVLYDLMTAGRQHAVSAGLGWAIVYYFFVGKPGIVKSFLAIAAVIFFSAIMGVMRSQHSMGITALWDSISILASGRFSIETVVDMSHQIGNQVEILQTMIEHADNHGFQYGRSYLYTFINIVPLVHFYNDTFPLSEYYRTAFNYSDTIGFDFAGLAEMYLQGGMLNIVVFNFLMGFLLSKFYVFALKKKSLSVILLYCSIIFGLLWWNRSDLLNALREVELFILLFFVYIILNRMSKKADIATTASDITVSAIHENNEHAKPI